MSVAQLKRIDITHVQKNYTTTGMECLMPVSSISGNVWNPVNRTLKKGKRSRRKYFILPSFPDKSGELANLDKICL
jgi:hypothetical protein